MNHFAGKIRILALVIGLLIWSQPMFVFSANETQPLKKIVIAYSGLSPSQAAAWMAY